MAFAFLFPRVINPEEGKKLADSWGAAFIESSAKENEVMFGASSVTRAAFTPTDDDLFSTQTAVEVFKRIILEMEKADGNVPSEEKKCAVM